MTDNEIIKAWECCENWESTKDCDDCPVKVGCSQKLAKYSLDLIKRKDAEIERLKADKIIAERHEKDARELYKDVVIQIKTAKSEAIKEFAERLKERADSGFWQEHSYVDVDDIDNLVKEMTEVNEK